MGFDLLNQADAILAGHQQIHQYQFGFQRQNLLIAFKPIMGSANHGAQLTV